MRKVLGFLSQRVSLRKLGTSKKALYRYIIITIYEVITPDDHPLTIEPKDSGYEIADISKKLRAGYPYSAADQKNHSLWKRQIKRHGLSRLTAVCMLCYVHACTTYVMPLLFSLSTRRLRISCSIFWRQFITFSWSIRCLTSWSCCQERIHLAKQNIAIKYDNKKTGLLAHSISLLPPRQYN